MGATLVISSDIPRIPPMNGTGPTYSYYDWLVDHNRGKNQLRVPWMIEKNEVRVD